MIQQVKRHLKHFAQWILLKENIHNNVDNRPHITEREVWWAVIGENVGSEIDGKSALFSRPVLVFKKLSTTTFLALPTTSSDKKGSWYVQVQYVQHNVSVILSQARVLDTRRLTTRIGRLTPRDYKAVQEGFKHLYLK